MKRLILFFFVLAQQLSMNPADGTSAQVSTAGARTEALFIVNNKIKEVREYIQELKKQLTESHMSKSQRFKSWKQRDLARYQREFRHTLFPKMIRDLGCLVDEVEKRKRRIFDEDSSVEEKDIQAVVDAAVLLKKKIDLESHMIELLFTIDQQEVELWLKSMHKHRSSRKRTASSVHEEIQTEEGLKKAKRSLERVRTHIAQTNDKLYEELGCAHERTAIDKQLLYSQRKGSKKFGMPKQRKKS